MLDLGTLTPELTFAKLLWLLGAGVSTAILHTLCGFAGGILLSILIAPVVGVVGIVPVMAVALLISASTRLWVFRHAIDWRVYRAIMVTGVPAIALGALVYGFLPPRIVAGLLGTFLLASVLVRRTLERWKFRPGGPTFPVLGSVFGLLSGSTIGAGMILVPFLVGAGIVGEKLAATFAAIGFTLNITKTLVFASSSVLDWHYALVGVAVGLSTLPGTYAGYWLLRHTSVRIHTMLVEGVIAAGGCMFLASAFGWR
jgi:uncharacterized membrane protein YfcA